MRAFKLTSWKAQKYFGTEWTRKKFFSLWGDWEKRRPVESYIWPETIYAFIVDAYHISHSKDLQFICQLLKYNLWKFKHRKSQKRENFARKAFSPS